MASAFKTFADAMSETETDACREASTLRTRSAAPILYSTLLYSTPLHSTLLYSTLVYSALFSTLLYSILCSTLFSTLPLFSTLLYSTLLCTLLFYVHAGRERSVTSFSQICAICAMKDYVLQSMMACQGFDKSIEQLFEELGNEKGLQVGRCDGNQMIDFAFASGRTCSAHRPSSMIVLR